MTKPTTEQVRYAFQQGSSWLMGPQYDRSQMDEGFDQWLADRLAEARAEALEEAANEILEAKATNGLGGVSSRLIDMYGDCSVWLFNRAFDIRAEKT